MRTEKKWIRCIMTVLFLLALSIGGNALNFSKVKSLADENAEQGTIRTVRVAFPEEPGLSEQDKYGTRKGILIDYLNEIAKYTGWEYEYVKVKNAEEMLSLFQNGEFDLLGGQYYKKEREEHYAYPDYTMGYSRAMILARKSDLSIRQGDLETLDGKTIGVYENAKETIRHLKAFLKVSGITCKLKKYSYEEMKDNNLYSYLLQGDVDLLLGNFLEDEEGMHVVASFKSQPFYLVTQPDNAQILEELNMALSKIQDVNPNFTEALYEKYFPSKGSTSDLTEEELLYVQKSDSIRIAVPKLWHPFLCTNEKEHLHDGIMPDILAKITEYSGLQFTYVYADSYAEAIELVQSGQAEMLGFFVGTDEAAAESGLVLSDCYSKTSNTIVRNKSVSYPDEGLVCGVLEGRSLPKSIVAEKVRTFRELSDGLEAANRGQIDMFYGMYSRMEREIQTQWFTNLVPISLMNHSENVSFAMKRPADVTFLAIMNKAIQAIPENQIEEIGSRNMISTGSSGFSIKEYFYANPMVFASMLGVILLLTICAVFRIARAKIDAAIMRANLEKAEVESMAKSKFLSRMSHEIRTPMNAIMGLADLTSMMDDVPVSIRDNLAKIRSSSKYMLSLINDILDMSQIENQMLFIMKDAFSMKIMLKSILNMMEPAAIQKGVTFEADISVLHNEVEGDAIRLKQVLTNLISNAVKFTPGGGKVIFRVEEIGHTQEEVSYRFLVKDTGVGIRSEDRERIFESFYQSGTSFSKSQGTGLGLAISYHIVRLMGGELEVTSEPGKGSEFYFTVTLQISQEKQTKEETKESHLLEGVHILLTEDNELNAEIAIRLLELQGAVVHWCENGKLATQYFKESDEGEIQAILMDIIMPEMNGLEAARVIRSMSRTDAKTIPIIAMTANSFQEDVDAALEAGMTGFLSKPFDVEHLFLTIKKVLQEG